MDLILDEIDRALKNKGLSAAAASKLAAGHYSLIKNMKAAKSEGKRYSVETLEKLAEVLDLELYFGPPRETAPVEQMTLEGDNYAHIPVHDAALSAGAGALNHGDEILGHLAFRRDWLKKLNLPASSARLARVTGDSMQPTLWPGDMVMMDTRINHLRPKPISMKDMRRPPVFAVIEDGEARVKRLQRPTADILLMLSDNPDYAPEYRQGADIDRVRILGKVVWWGHTVKE